MCLSFFNIGEYIKQRERRRIYSTLHKTIENGEMVLVWPICQGLDEKYSLIFDHGFCWGYTTEWMEAIVRADKLKLSSFSEEDWLKLEGNSSYHLESMPLTAFIKERHENESQAIETYWSKKENFDSYDDLFYRYLQMVPDEFPEKTHQIFRFNLYKKYDEPNCISKRIFDSKPSFRHGHTILIGKDADHHVHYFDANLGWFRSKNPCDKIMDLKDQLLGLLKICGYHDKYSVLHISQRSHGFIATGLQKEKESAEEQQIEEAAKNILKYGSLVSE